MLCAQEVSGGSCCLNILDNLLDRSYDEAAAENTNDSAVILPVDPIVRIAASFISQLLCHTAVVPACDDVLAHSLGGSSALPPGHCPAQQQVAGLGTIRETRWRLWKLQRDAVILLLKCAQSPLHPHLTPTLVFIISGALQVGAVFEPLHVFPLMAASPRFSLLISHFITLPFEGTMRRRGQTRQAASGSRRMRNSRLQRLNSRALAGHAYCICL